ncbi:MAG TPA: peptidase S10, partial [Planctomycetota bacterium]|nr:peptidase S10 [Planctomycetota bacterium]
MRSALLLAALLAGPATEQDPVPSEEPEELEDDLAYADHVLALPDGALEYETVAGTLVLREEDGDARASVFHVAYLEAGLGEDAEALAARPVTFCFNGGPGSSSVWLHLGAFGPRRVDLGEDGFRLAPPFRLVDNPHGLLDLTDLVFVDPVTTGYSRAAEGVDDKDFHGVDADVESVGEFVRLWLTRNGRWTSPIYLAGESYGTTRAAKLARHLQERHGIYPSGAVLVSSILQFGTARFDTGNDLPYVLFLPTYAATAWYHGRLDAELQALPVADLAARARAFALGPYAAALLRG